MEKLFGIDKVLVIIYKNLTFTDQLSLSQVNSFLGNIFASFIVPEKYRQLQVRKLCNKEKFLVSNVSDEDCFLLTHKEMENFFKFGFDRVESLITYKCLFTTQTSCAASWETLKNLTHICYENIPVSEKHLLLIAANCPKLCALELRNCISEDTNGPLMIGQGVSVSTLEQMKQLKFLIVLNGEFINIELDMNVFCELITKIPLEFLSTNAGVEQQVDGNLNERTFHQHLKVLVIDFDYRHTSIMFCEGTFKNLSMLHLSIMKCTDSDLQTIAKECENLELLSFGEWVNFENITHFVIPPNLKEFYSLTLSLKNTHVIDILTKFKIEIFSVTVTSLLNWRLFRNVRPSPYINVLNIKNRSTFRFPSLYANNNTLKELNWYEDEDDYEDDYEIFENWSLNGKCLNTCRNLEFLCVHGGFVHLDVILELKKLHKLIITILSLKQNWAYIIGILKHTSLKVLIIENDDNVSYLFDCTNQCIQGIPSNIELICLKFDFLLLNLEFWLDMLQQNPKMSIECIFSYFHQLSLLEKLVSHDNFPNDLKEIKISGFNLNCQDLRENFAANIDPIMQLKDEKIRFDNKTIILKRSF